MANELYPLGVRRDGSYYTRVLWCDTTGNDPFGNNPRLWVNNLIDDDIKRDGGTWGAPVTETETANAMLDFFGETLPIKKISIYKNVGIAISVHEELAKYISIYVSTSDAPLAIRTAEDKIDSVEWTKIAKFDIVKEEGWQTIVLDKAVDAKFIRVELNQNFCKHDDSYIPWCETSELKLYPNA